MSLFSEENRFSKQQKVISLLNDDDEGSCSDADAHDHDDVEVVEIKNQDESLKISFFPRSNDANSDNNTDEEIELVGERNATRLPHLRCHCVTFAFLELKASSKIPSSEKRCKKNKGKNCKSNDSDGNINFCELCYCYVCDVPVKECRNWKVHCHAYDGLPRWVAERKRHYLKRKRDKVIHNDNVNSKASQTSEPVITIDLTDDDGVDETAVRQPQNGVSARRDKISFRASPKDETNLVSVLELFKNTQCVVITITQEKLSFREHRDATSQSIDGFREVLLGKSAFSSYVSNCGDDKSTRTVVLNDFPKIYRALRNYKISDGRLHLDIDDSHLQIFLTGQSTHRRSDKAAFESISSSLRANDVAINKAYVSPALYTSKRATVVEFGSNRLKEIIKKIAKPSKKNHAMISLTKRGLKFSISDGSPTRRSFCGENDILIRKERLAIEHYKVFDKKIDLNCLREFASNFKSDCRLKLLVGDELPVKISWRNREAETSLFFMPT